MWVYVSRISLFLVLFYRFSSVEPSLEGHVTPPYPVICAHGLTPISGDNLRRHSVATLTLLAILLSFHFLELFLRMPCSSHMGTCMCRGHQWPLQKKIFSSHLSSHKQHISRALLNSNCFMEPSNIRLNKQFYWDFSCSVSIIHHVIHIFWYNFFPHFTKRWDFYRGFFDI